MKKALLIFSWAPLVSFAQNSPKFENDTLYTTGGYKIYIGQTLQFGVPAGGKKKFNYVDIKNGVSPHSLENNTVTVKEFRDFEIPSQKDPYVDIVGSINFRDGSKGYILLRLWFEQAIGYNATIPGELIVPKEFIATTTTIKDSLFSPRFQLDTLYTSCGYKIYKGLILQFGKATRTGEFQYVNIKNNVPHLMLQYHSVRVNEMKDFGISALGNGYITISGTLLVNNSERGIIVIHMAFDHAIENIPGIPSELVVPEKFRNKLKIEPSQEIERIRRLYAYGTISSEEFEAAKKKILAQ